MFMLMKHLSNFGLINLVDGPSFDTGWLSTINYPSVVFPIPYIIIKPYLKSLEHYKYNLEV